ncbi:MAG TPA: hypothetical protein QGI71_02840 [Dehalococcoidia bacterium]|nr:hypothetical protein [Dehalococcoidia bacterium]
MHTLTLGDDDLLPLYLAVVYHLGRPGSEALAMGHPELGLATVREAIDPQLGLASAQVEVGDYQLRRIGLGLHGIVSELKQFGMAQGRSVVPGFSEAVVRLFPDAREEGGALDLVQPAIMFRRRLDGAVRQAEAAVEAARIAQAEPAAEQRSPWWKLWRR